MADYTPFNTTGTANPVIDITGSEGTLIRDIFIDNFTSPIGILMGHGPNGGPGLM